MKAGASNAEDAGIAYDGAQQVSTGFRNTDLGLLPTEWDVRTLGELGQSLIGLTYDPQDIDPSGVLVLRSSNIENNSLQFGGDVYVKTDIPDRIVARRDDLLICVRNGSRPLIGKCALIDEGAVGMTFGAFMSVFRSADARFVFHCFQSDIIKRQINEHLGATINQITNKSLNSFKIPYPERREREAITAALSDMDELLDGLEALIAKKQDIRHGTIQHLLTGSIRLPGFAGKWQTKSMSQLAQIDPESLGSNTPSEFKFNYISLEQVHAGSLIGYSTLEFGSAPSRARRIVKPGDVLMSAVRPNLKGHLLFSGQVPNAVCSTGFVVLRAKDGLCEPGFLFAHLMGPVVGTQVEKALVGSNYPALNSRDVELISIPCPPTMQEQHSIAEVLSDMGAELSALVQRRDKTRAIRQGMMQELLTGHTRLI